MASIAWLEARIGDTDAAKATVETITDPDARETGYARVASALTESGDLNAARVWLDRIKSPKAQAEAWVGVACALPAPAR